jgi:hypothetical protein
MDEENQEGIIVFVDLEKADDRVEWGCVNHFIIDFWPGRFLIFN